ncbi:MAG: class I SAM-dependent methyltransferase [Gemmatimonadota bacterium]
MTERQEHWEAVYRTRPPDQVGWYQAEPELSLRFIRSCSPEACGRVLDVGGGASLLADFLVREGGWDVTVMDISQAALDTAAARLGPLASRVRWVRADVTRMPDVGPVDVWHDRAVFHFLTDPGDRAAYRDAVLRHVPPGRWVVLATFRPGAPPKCSGLDVVRYDAEGLSTELGPDFELVEEATEEHYTPGGTHQPYIFTRFQRERRT